WQIAGNGIAPQIGLPTTVLHEDARVSAERGIGEHDRASHVSIELCVGLCSIDLPQEHLAMCPGETEDAIRETPVLVFFSQTQTGGARLADAGHDVDRHFFFWIEHDFMTDGDDRIEHRPFAAREGRVTGHGLWIGDSVSPADEAHPVSFVGYFFDLRTMNRH